MKKGFTLMELLAVIVILAIIALIATPIVLNIINDSKESATLRSADFYLDAVELSIANRVMHHGSIADDDYPIMSNGNICLKEYKKEGTPEIETCGGKPLAEVKKEDILKVEVNDETPKSGKIAITNGNISSIELNYKDGKTIVKNSDGDLVYHDRTSSVKLCTANTTKATALVWIPGNSPGLESSYATEEVGLLAGTDGAYTPGVAYTCNFIDDSETNNMTFFVLSSTEDMVTLIAGANLEGAVAWREAVTAKAALAERTSNWSSANGGKLSEEQMLTVKLPTAYQIAEAVGQTFSDSSISGLPTWLHTYTKVPGAVGYWTSTSAAYDSSSAWGVHSNGSVANPPKDSTTLYGIRPVITISKSNV